MKSKTRTLVIIAILSVILFVQEQVLNFLPNINLTIFLLVLYSKKLGFKMTSAIIFIYCLLDNIIMGSFNITYFPFMLIGWLLVPLFVCIIFKDINDEKRLALLGAGLSFLYCWVFIIPGILIMKIGFLSYLVSDIPFELLLALSSFLSILLLYKPCSSLFDHYILKQG